MKNILFVVLALGINIASFSQSASKIESQDQIYSYAYVSAQGKLFTKKLKVEEDFGDTDEQILKGDEFSKILNNKKSYAAILNYMVDHGFELVETLDYLTIFQGTGGTTGVAFILRKKKER